MCFQIQAQRLFLTVSAVEGEDDGAVPSVVELSWLAKGGEVPGGELSRGKTSSKRRGSMSLKASDGWVEEAIKTIATIV
jgi:hypothetical protein